MDDSINWTVPAKLYHRTELAKGPPRERLELMGETTLIDCTRHALSGSGGPLKNMVIKLDNNTEIAGEAIRRLANAR